MTTEARAGKVATVEGELRVPNATVQLVHFHSAEPADDLLRVDDAYWFDLCLTPRPRNARACYPERWSAQRFERIGSVFLVPPHEVVRARSDDGIRQTSIILRLDPDSFRLHGGREPVWTDRHLEASLDIPEPHIRSLLQRLAEEVRHPGFASETLVELIAGQLAIELCRYSSTIEEDPPQGGLAPWRLRRIDERLREVGEPPNLSELASLCQVSMRQLTRGFRASRHRSIGDTIADSRIDHARRLLASDQSVKAAAYSLGFASPSGFCFAFRRATGETPRQFQQRVRQHARRTTH